MESLNKDDSSDDEMSVEFEEERDTFIFKDAFNPKNVSKIGSMHLTGHQSVESIDAVKIHFGGIPLKAAPQSRRGTEKTKGMFSKQVSFNSVVMDTSESRETNL